MNKENIEKFICNKGELITKILLSSYDSADFEINSESIEKEVFDVSLSYARIFFFEAGSFLDEESRDEYKSHVLARFNVEKKKVLKMNDINLLAHCIKVEVIDRLDDQDILFL